MPSVNKAILVGYLGKPPEIRYTQSGDAVCNFSMATSDNYTDKQGMKQEKTEWHNVTTFSKLAEICGEYLRKGSLVYIEGKIQTRKWQDKQGIDRYSTEIVADRMQMLGGKQEGEAAERPMRPAKEDGKANAYQPEPSEDPFDDLPF